MHCIPLRISLCFMHLDVCLFVENCVLLGLNLVEPMMQFLLACHMFMHTYPFFSFYLVWVVIGFLSLSLSDRLHMAPKRNSTSVQNPLRSRSSSSSDLPSTHVRFHDEKAH